MTDRELLELAARAVGYDTSHSMNAERLLLDPPVDALYVRKDGGIVSTGWNPLKDDGHALRLSNKLRLSIRNIAGLVIIMRHEERLTTEHHCETDVDAATRRAIVRAAADIGRTMQSPSST